MSSGQTLAVMSIGFKKKSVEKIIFWARSRIGNYNGPGERGLCKRGANIDFRCKLFCDR
jgi:hypothetical protein